MEEDFARLLRSMTTGQVDVSYSTNDAWSPEESESDELDAVLHERQQARLAAITAALRRFDTGAYGKCARCGSRISFSRLSVMPEATLCRACGGT
jgi:RNA polymerase-binding transcription factor DksA